MSYVYLIEHHPNDNELEPHDVGVIVSERSDGYEIKYLRENKTVFTPLEYVDFFEISETGDESSHKVCDRCFKHLETELMFSNNRIKKGGKVTKRPSCKNCRKLKDGIPISKKNRDEWNLTKPADYSSFTCPICEKTSIAGISKIVLDHCHHTGKVRGWVCESCNTGIGRFDDDPNIVYRAIEWLMKED